MKTILLAVLLCLTACAGINTQSQKIEAACVTRNAAVDSLLVGLAAGKVNRAQYDAVKPAVDTTGAVCQADTPSLDSVKYVAFQAAIAKLVAAAGAAK